jgi:hypothetical protein
MCGHHIASFDCNTILTSNFKIEGAEFVINISDVVSLVEEYFSGQNFGSGVHTIVLLK